MAIAHDEGHATDVGADHRHTAGQRLQHRVGHVVDRAGVDRNIGLTVQGGDLLPVQPARHRDSSLQTEAGHQRRQRRPLGAGSGNRQARLWMVPPQDRQRLHRVGVVVDRFKTADHDQMGTPRAVSRCRTKPGQIDDVRHDLRLDAVARKHALQEARRHDQQGIPAGKRAPHLVVSSRQERARLAAAVVDDHRHSPPRADANRRRRKQVPGPAGVRHHVEQVAAPRCAPKAQQIGQQPEQRAQHRETANP